MAIFTADFMDFIELTLIPKCMVQYYFLKQWAPEGSKCKNSALLPLRGAVHTGNTVDMLKTVDVSQKQDRSL